VVRVGVGVRIGFGVGVLGVGVGWGLGVRWSFLGLGSQGRKKARCSTLFAALIQIDPETSTYCSQRPSPSAPTPSTTDPKVDRQWYGPALLWTRDDASGVWQPTADYPPGAPDPPASTSQTSAAAGGGLEAAATGGDAAAAAANGNGAAPGLSRAPVVAAAVADGSAAPPQATGRKRGTPAKQEGSNGLAAAANGAHAEAAETAAANGDAAAAAAAPAALELAEFEQTLQACLCLVDVDVPLVALTDGVHSRSFAGNGLVVFQGQNVGLVLVDRNTVAIGCGGLGAAGLALFVVLGCN